MKVTYKKFGPGTVTTLWWLLLTRCRRLGWKGNLTGRRSGSRTYVMQKALWLLYLAGRGAPAFNPDAPDPVHKRRHMRATIRALGEWAQAVDVTDAEGLIAAARKLGIELNRPYNPPEFWHVQAVRRFALKPVLKQKVDTQRQRDEHLVKLMAEHKIVYPRIALREARATGLPLHYACAMLVKESGGGRNVFGHDPTRSIPKSWMGQAVTLLRYRTYRRNRKAGLGMQGVGGTQLTWYAYQDQADALGGCHLPGPQMHVGFSLLRALIRTYGPQKGAARYNGTGPRADAYGRDFIIKAAAWKAVLSK